MSKDFSPVALTSAAVGYPARLCVITRTDGTVYLIAESDTAITVSGDTYAVVPGLQISAVRHTSNGEMPSCEINAVHQVGATFDSDDIDIGYFDGATVQLYIVDRLNLSRKGLLFTGSISTTSHDNENHVVFSVKGPAVQAKRLMTQKFAPMCRVDLYSTLCGVNPASYDVTVTVESIVDSFNFIAGFVTTPPADGYFNQGVGVTASGTSFEIANWVQSSQQITAYLPCNRILTVGGTLTIYPGCDHTVSSGNGCDKFNNQENFQAEPHFLGTAAAAQQV